MTRRRDTRRFGPGPFVLGLRREGGWGRGFPYHVPAVAAIDQLELGCPVTMLAGENGSGKSIYGDVPLHQQSHGESFLALAANRFGGEGFYVLDEPEAALSVSGQLALLAVIARAAGDGVQFIVATHSPILLACPQARVYELDETGLTTPNYDDLEAVRLTRGFLDAPGRYLRAVEGEAGDE